MKTTKLWVWNGWSHEGPIECEGTPIPGEDRFALLGDSDGYHVTVVQLYVNAYETREACLKKALAEAQISVTSAQRRVSDIERMLEKENNA